MDKHRSKTADFVIYTVAAILGLTTLIPLVHIFNVSISNPQNVMSRTLMLWPENLTMESYRMIFRNNVLLQGFGVTTFITIVGTVLNLLFTTSAAYVLSRTDLPGNSLIMVFIVLTIVFNPGLIPEYMLFRSLGLVDSVWALIFFGMINGFNLILMRNFFWSVPDALVESARIDGCSELKLLFRIMIPLSVPAIITVGLFYAVVHWNEFFRGIIYINDAKKWPLQVVLRGIVMQADHTSLGGGQATYIGTKVNVQTIQSAAITAATIPVLVVFPFLQKYYNKGIMLGSVKG